MKRHPTKRKLGKAFCTLGFAQNATRQNASGENIFKNIKN